MYNFLIRKRKCTNKRLKEIMREIILSLWIAPDTSKLAKSIYEYLKLKQDAIIYYIDSVNSFPLNELREITSVNDNTIFERIHIVTCFDLVELKRTIMKITEDPRNNNCKIMIHGIDTMMNNSRIQISNQDQVYSILNNILLQLRINYKGSLLITGPRLKKRRIERNKNNRNNFNHNNNNSGNDGSHNMLMNDVIEYINRFYCDDVV